MKEIALTKGMVALIDDEDYELVSQYKWWYHHDPNLVRGSKGYAYHTTWDPTMKRRGILRMHRIVLGLTDNTLVVDHINGDGLDNRRCNLRACTRTQNQRNMPKRGANKYRGVIKDHNRWQAKIKLDGSIRNLGSFTSEEGAARAYDNAVIASGCEFFTLNFPESRPKYKYLPGHPKNYNFSEEAGIFNVNGGPAIGKTLTFQPIAWRIFTDNILGQGSKNWAELFFIDDKQCVCAILFHSYSVDNIYRLAEQFYYDDITLADVVLTVTPEKKTNVKIQPVGTYYIAQFTYVMADATKTAELKQYATDYNIYRHETLTDVANIKTAFNYYNPFHHAADEAPALGSGQVAALPAGQ